MGARPVRLLRLRGLPLRGPQHRRAQPRGPHHRRAAGVATARPGGGLRRAWRVRVHAPPAVLVVPGRLQPRRQRGAAALVHHARRAGGVRRARPLLLRGGPRRRALRDRGRRRWSAVHATAGGRLLALCARHMRVRRLGPERGRAQPPRGRAPQRQRRPGAGHDRAPGQHHRPRPPGARPAPARAAPRRRGALPRGRRCRATSRSRRWCSTPRSPPSRTSATAAWRSPCRSRCRRAAPCG